MTKEAKYGILMLAALAILVPLAALLIQAGAHTLYLIFTKPVEVLIFLSGLFIGSYLNNKLK